jgi:2-oxoisovalerate dehydrogenase E1 component
VSEPSEPARPKAALLKSATRLLHRHRVVDRLFTETVSSWAPSAGAPLPDGAIVDPESGLSAGDLRKILESQMRSRRLDYVARELRLRQLGYYTIGGAGHEGNAVLGRLLRLDDPVFLHYRSGAFMFERARKRPGLDLVHDALLGLVASAEDPASGGRHKVWAHPELGVPPQTSTIASHLPKGFGTAALLAHARRIGVSDRSADAVVMVSFGDASVNHASAQAAFNAASWTAHQGLPCPVLWVCEDNGYGISVPTPHDWVRASMAGRPSTAYVEADGLDPVAAYAAARRAVDLCRRTRRPVFLHLRVVRLLGHAGTDTETDYRPLAEIEADERRDPLLVGGARACTLGAATPAWLLERYEAIRREIEACAEEVAARPKLASAAAVMAPLGPHHPEEVAREAARTAPADVRAQAFGGADALPERQPPRHLARQINAALADLLAASPEALVFGEDVARKGGVYTVTAGLHARFGPNRVFNTLLDETTILGIAQGAAHLGLLPVPEIQYLAYFHNACDQIRGEACSLQYFSAGRFRNGFVLRLPGLAYQKGFGGHFHNDNAITALRDIPGLVVATAGRGDDAVRVLRTLFALARVDGRVAVFLEPIALYMTKDLHEEKDGLWLAPYPAPGEALPLGTPRVYGPDDAPLVVFTYANGTYFTLRAAERLRRLGLPAVRVVDLLWLKPLDAGVLARESAGRRAVLVVDEGRRTGGIAEEIFTLLDEAGYAGRKERLAGEDTYIPLGPAADHVLVREEDVERALRRLLTEEEASGARGARGTRARGRRPTPRRRGR